MIKVESIEKIEDYSLTCKFNNNIQKKLDVLPLIQKHKNLQGIEKLLDNEIFSKVRIGETGEIVWDKIIEINYKGEEMVWDYDISPEFAFANGI